MSCIEVYLGNELNIAPKEILVDIVKNTVIVDSNRVKEYIEMTLEAIDAEGKMRKQVSTPRGVERAV